MFGKIVKIIGNVFLFGLAAIGVLVVFSFVNIPGNYKIFIVQSGSMEPAIRTGSLIFVKPMSDYNIGDIVTRRTVDPKTTITHRIFSKEVGIDGQSSYITKGDANNTSDGEKFTKEKIIGKEFFTIPYLGFPVGFARTTQGLILLIIIPAALIIFDEMIKIKSEIRKK